jgi:hypothetical protein
LPVLGARFRGNVEIQEQNVGNTKVQARHGGLAKGISRL